MKARALHTFPVDDPTKRHLRGSVDFLGQSGHLVRSQLNIVFNTFRPHIHYIRYSHR